MQTLEKINFYQKRDLGDIINTTFAFVRQNFKPLAMSLLQIAGPVILITGLTNGWYQLAIKEKQFSVILSAGSFMFITIMLCVAVISAVTFHYMLIYMERGDSNIEVADVWNKVKKDLGMLILTTIGTSILLVIGFVFLFFPGIYLMCLLSFMTIIRVKERIGFMDAISRCRFLVKDNWWNSFAVLMVAGILVSVLSIVFSLPNTIIAIMDGMHQADPEKFSGLNSSSVTVLITSAIAAIGTYLLYSILFVATALQYFNLVERKEAAGLLNRLDTLGNPNIKENDSEDY